MSVVRIPPMGYIIIITLCLHPQTGTMETIIIRYRLHFVSIMTKCAGKNSMWLGVQVVDIKIWNLNLFSINRSTTICAWHILVINDPICKFCLSGGKMKLVSCLWPRMRTLGVRIKNEVLEKHFLTMGNTLPRTEERELCSYLWMMSRSAEAGAFQAAMTFPGIQFPLSANKFLFFISLLLKEDLFQERINIYWASPTVCRCAEYLYEWNHFNI